MDYKNVLDFWFSELTPKDWFTTNEAVDAAIRDRFLSTHEAAAANELSSWRENAEGSLAEIIVLDQFSRNLFRGTREAFSQDAQALALAQVAVARQFDKAIEKERRTFFYLPFMHSESPRIHEIAVTLFEAHGDKEALKYELIHKDIIDRFGRYPHRNAALGRASTEDERAYLKEEDQPFF